MHSKYVWEKNRVEFFTTPKLGKIPKCEKKSTKVKSRIFALISSDYNIRLNKKAYFFYNVVLRRTPG